MISWTASENEEARRLRLNVHADFFDANGGKVTLEL